MPLMQDAGSPPFGRTQTAVLTFAVLLALPLSAIADSTVSIRAFLDGHRATFSTKGHPKAKRAHFTIAYPPTWVAKEGDRPNIVQKFVSDGGRGLEVVTILTRSLPLPPDTVLTEQDQKDLLSPSELRALLPPGATFVDAKSTTIDATPAGILEYKMRAERVGVTVYLQFWALNFLLEDTFVQVGFMAGGSTEVEAARRMDTFRPLFTSMALSIVFRDKWTASPQAQASQSGASTAAAFSLPNDDPPMLILTLIIGVLVTWGVGLTPSFLVRYAFVRRPLSHKAASWFAAGFSVFFWVSETALAHALGDKPGKGVVWIIMFFVARWLMSRGYTSPSSSDDIRTEHVAP